MDNPRIVRIEWGVLEGRRPRSAGSNARLGVHGDTIRVSLVRLSDEEGASGFGVSWADQETLKRLLGSRMEDLFSSERGVTDLGRAVEYPIWDLAGQRMGMPVYALAAAINGRETPASLSVPCYDTSLYFDDLHLSSTQEAEQLLAAEAREGYANGHRAFKIKVGRGARHMPLQAGTERDVAVVRAVRAAVGPDCALMLDANNGFNLNLAKTVLEQTADCSIHWLEEPFHEDGMLYRDLREWQQERGLAVAIADGEGDASPHLLRWAREGLINVIQYDIFGYGLTRWLHLSKQLDEWGVRAAPHHYGGHVGNYVACHLAAAAQRFAFVEWDEATTFGLDGSGYQVEAGQVSVPNAPGFGLTLDEAAFRQAVETGGGQLAMDDDYGQN